jgi:hypothetical protein
VIHVSLFALEFFSLSLSLSLSLSHTHKALEGPGVGMGLHLQKDLAKKLKCTIVHLLTQIAIAKHDTTESNFSQVAIY